MFSAGALADPSHNIFDPQTLNCDNNTTVVVNPGTVTNQSHMGFVVNSTNVFVLNYLAFTDSTGTLVFFETARGLGNLISCSGDAGGGFTITVRGFITPRR
jgi:hypothetical protein